MSSRLKLVASFLAGNVTGLVAGAGAMLVAFPFLFPPPALDEPPPGQANLTLPAPAATPALIQASAGPQAATRIAAGVFDQTSPGRDALHWANGGVSLFRQGERLILRLESDFVAGPGPDFWIYLNTRAVGDEADFKADRGRTKLTKLRGFKGGQNYTLPAGTDLSRLRSVTIWCESFSEFIANAVIAPTPV
jgi:hypothetical protein